MRPDSSQPFHYFEDTMNNNSLQTEPIGEAVVEAEGRRETVTSTKIRSTKTILAANPSCIPPDATLSNLLDVKRSWMIHAMELNYPAICWEVLNSLGTHAPLTGYPDMKIWRSGDVSLIGNEEHTSYVPGLCAWLTKRSVSAWLANDETLERNRDLLGNLRRQSPVDQVVFSSDCVMRVTWTFTGKDDPKVDNKVSLFLPGKWFDAILIALPDTEAAVQRKALNANEAKRRLLLNELMAGHQI